MDVFKNEEWKVYLEINSLLVASADNHSHVAIYNLCLLPGSRAINNDLKIPSLATIIDP